MEIRHLRRSLKNGGEFGNMLSKTPEMHRLFETIRMVASTDMAVVIEGESGTGKDLLASAVHYRSARRERPFLTMNCAGLPDSLIEQELFGHDSNGSPPQPGKIELAHGGTLFLDEVAGLSMALQGKLLNVIEERKLQRAGSHVSLPVDVRVITGTSVPLKRLVADGKMRSDFYYRITVIPIRLLPLRQRSVDIPLLVSRFVASQCGRSAETHHHRFQAGNAIIAQLHLARKHSGAAKRSRTRHRAHHRKSDRESGSTESRLGNESTEPRINNTRALARRERKTVPGAKARRLPRQYQSHRA